MGIMTVEYRKRLQRRQLLALRMELGMAAREEADAGIEERVCALPAFAEADVLLAYLDFGSEVRTRGIIERAWAADKTVAIPWCVPETRNIRWFRITSFDALVQNPLGMEEPVPDDETEQLLDTGERMLALAPGLTFDTSGYRIGYGGGYYDTFLSAFDGVVAGLCREAQMSGDLRADGLVEPHDLPVQMVVTEARTIEAS